MLPLNRSRNRSRFFGLAVPQSSLDLNFLSGTLDPRITFTRASSGTFFGSNGLLQTASNDVPRFDYDPSTLAPRGLLIEEQRTNLLTWSENFGDAAWTQQRVTVATNSTIAPNGTTTADRITGDGTTGGAMGAYATVSVSGSTAYTLSVFAKADTATWLVISSFDGATNPGQWFNLANGTVGVSESGMSNPSIVAVGGGWYWCSVVRTTGSTSTSARAQYSLGQSNGTYATSATTSLILWGAQLEAGAFATSYIPTTSAAATRAADLASMTGANFSSWFNASQGTLFAETQIGRTPSVASTIFAISDGTTTNLIDLRYREIGTVGAQVINNNIPQVQNTTGPVATPNLLVRDAFGYVENNFAESINGIAPIIDTSGLLPTVNRSFIGVNSAGTASFLNGHIRRIVYWPVRVPNSQLQFITA